MKPKKEPLKTIIFDTSCQILKLGNHKIHLVNGKLVSKKTYDKEIKRQQMEELDKAIEEILDND